MAKGRKTGGRDFVKGDPRAGRPKGAKDKVKRGSIRAVYRDLIETDGLHEDMKAAVKEGVNNPKRALGYMELGARVLDRVDDKKGAGLAPVTINFISNIRPDRLRAAAVRARRPALRPAEAQNPPAFPLSREKTLTRRAAT